jgi:hypothetical protein
MSVLLSVILTAVARACPGALDSAVRTAFAQDTGPHTACVCLRVRQVPGRNDIFRRFGNDAGKVWN